MAGDEMPKTLGGCSGSDDQEEAKWAAALEAVFYKRGVVAKKMSDWGGF